MPLQSPNDPWLACPFLFQTYPDGVLEIHWGNGMSYSEGYIPLDSPVCGFRNEKCPESKAITKLYFVKDLVKSFYLKCFDLNVYQ